MVPEGGCLLISGLVGKERKENSVLTQLSLFSFVAVAAVVVVVVQPRIPAHGMMPNVGRSSSNLL